MKRSRSICSLEPLLGSLDLSRHWKSIDWGIVGGESGPGARECQFERIASLVRQFRSAGKPLFVKQLGTRPTIGLSAVCLNEQGRWPGGVQLVDSAPQRPRFNCRKHIILRARKGDDPSEWPVGLRVQQFPQTEKVVN